MCIFLGMNLLNACKATSSVNDINQLSSWTPITKGQIQKYHLQKGISRHDLSGAATNGRFIMTVDDGGKHAEYQFLHSMSMDLSDNVRFRLSQHHKDLEAATYQNGYFVITTSLGKVGLENKGYRLTTRFKWDGHQVSDEVTVDLRKPLLQALMKKYPENWYQSMSISSSKKGGLNIEGLTISGEDPQSLIFAFRSPLSPKYTQGITGATSTGKAILASVKGTFTDKPVFDFKEIDLGGHGVRGIEYFSSLQGYLILGGTTYKSDNYSLWFLPLNNKIAQPIYLHDFDKLCRPETVIPIKEKGIDIVLIFSEQAGKACINNNFNYIKASLHQ